MSTTISTILLAEEHDATRAFLADNLTADGYRVLVAPDRAKALALLTTAHPDLILVDVNGQTLGLLDAIRSGEGIAGRVDPDMPLIVLSRDADRLQRIRMLERGGDDVVESRSPTRSCAPGSRRCCVARRSGAERGSCARPDRDRRPLARGARVRPAGRAVGQGVPAAGHARRRADAGVHPRGADALRLGVADVRADEDARQPRVAAAAQAVRRATTSSWSTCGASATGSLMGYSSAEAPATAR